MTRALPFRSRGLVRQRGAGGTTLALDVPCSVWPARPRANAAGMTWDHEGEATLAFPTPTDANLELVVDGTTYLVMEAVAHDFVPHVALRLRRARGAGA